MEELRKEMEKLYLLKTEKMGLYEKGQGFASYATIIDMFAGNIVLCNNILELDASVLDNITMREDYEDGPAIFQWYLCNLTDFDRQYLINAGVVLSYSNLLDLDVICVDHWGTGWDYVLTDIKLFDTYDELIAQQEKDKQEGK